MMAKQLHRLDEAAFVTAAADCGVAALKLDAVKTQHLKQFCGLTDNQLVKVGRCLRAENNNRTVLACRAYLHYMVGRYGHQSSKCIWCKLNHGDWQHNPNDTGAAFTIPSMLADRAVLENLYQQYLQTPGPHLSLKDFIRDYTSRDKSYGFRGLQVLLPSIPIERFLLPTLHVMLGIGNKIIDNIDRFIERQLERDMVDEKPVRDSFYHMLSEDYSVVPHKYYTQHWSAMTSTVS